jgi:uncharacterized protein (DUF362 family)
MIGRQIMSRAPNISIAKGHDPYSVTRQALSRMDPTPVSGRNILLKPRAGQPLLPETGGSTHPKVIEAAIDWFHENHAKSIAVAECPALGICAEKAFLTSLATLCEKKNVALIDIDHYSRIWLDIFDGTALDRITATGLLVDYDFIVSIPTMSTCGNDGVALSLENLVGLVPRHHKLLFHHQVHTNVNDQAVGSRDTLLADLARVLYPDMVIIDGIIGMEGDGPCNGRPKNAGLIVAGDDALFADKIASELMGINPAEIQHFNRVDNLPGHHHDSAAVTPADWKQWITPFARPKVDTTLSGPVIEIFNHNGCTSCQNALYRFMEHHYTQLKPGENIRFSMGPEGPQYPGGTYYVGNCAASRDADQSGYHCNGCPPQERQIWEALQKGR